MLPVPTQDHSDTRRRSMCEAGSVKDKGMKIQQAKGGTGERHGIKSKKAGTDWNLKIQK